MTTLARRLAHARATRSMTLGEVALASGLAVERVQQLETVPPATREEVAALAAALKVDAAWLGATGSTALEGSELARALDALLASISALSRDEREALVPWMQALCLAPDSSIARAEIVRRLERRG